MNGPKTNLSSKYDKYSMTCPSMSFCSGTNEADLTKAIWAEVEMLRTASLEESIRVERTEH